MKESDVKRQAVDTIKMAGGYARRLEDLYAVGLPDVVGVLWGNTFFIEFKMARGNSFGATPRQVIEADRINRAGGTAFMCGWHEGQFFFAETTGSVHLSACFCHPQGFLSGLQGYIENRRAANAAGHQPQN